MVVGLRELLRVPPEGFELAGVDARATPGLPGTAKVRRDPKAWARRELEPLGERLSSAQERLYAGAKGGAPGTPETLRRVLLVLQAMDCGGKDGTIKRVAGAMNPLGLRIVAFGPPTREERARHFLWRIRRALPGYGQVGVFNRSHYEDVLVARVRKLVPPRVWRGRYEQINRFERRLVDGGLTFVKVLLHISYQEQRDRLLQRLDDPSKHWKYDPADVDERRYWDEYQAAYGDALRECTTSEAPWFVVPADRKWYRDWAVAGLLLETMEQLDLRYPEPTFDVSAERRRLLEDQAG